MRIGILKNFRILFHSLFGILPSLFIGTGHWYWKNMIGMSHTYTLVHISRHWGHPFRAGDFFILCNWLLSIIVIEYGMQFHIKSQGNFIKFEFEFEINLHQITQKFHHVVLCFAPIDNSISLSFCCEHILNLFRDPVLYNTYRFSYILCINICNCAGKLNHFLCFQCHYFWRCRKKGQLQVGES